MPQKYIISIDQSTQGTKALLFDEAGFLIKREDIPHRQIVDENGWISHDPIEIYENTLTVVKRLIDKSAINKTEIKCIGISNQRETSLIWDKKTGCPIADAIVWQCSRSQDICDNIKNTGMSEVIWQKTGLRLSPYFPASKFTWLLKNVAAAQEKAERHELCFGTIDTWLIYKLTGGREYKTDYSNASRTQLFDIFKLEWDDEICKMFGINKIDLPEVCDSDSNFGVTDFEGYLEQPIPIHGVLGDSHGALFGHGCLKKGMVKTTYGTGASVMMNIGEVPVLNQNVVTSLAWKIDGKVNYVYEGNINYAGAVISWLKDDVKLIKSSAETENLCNLAVKDDDLYFVPSFSGVGAPYWNSKAKAVLTGITRTTGKAEIVRAGIECIAYQIADVIDIMRRETRIKELRVDGGPSKNQYLMQFQSNILNINIMVPEAEEFSGIGAAYAAGLGMGIYGLEIYDNNKNKKYKSNMNQKKREQKQNGWRNSVKSVLCETNNGG